MQNKKELITSEILDNYLANGYFRTNNQMIKHTDCWNDNQENDDVFNIRIVLNKVVNLKNKSVYKRNKNFTVEVFDFFVNHEIEQLFELYKLSIRFKLDKKLADYFINNKAIVGAEGIFETKQIQVRDNGKLIAVGYFDKGKQALQGIVNIYDPQYKKNSLGKFLLLNKIEFGLKNNMDYFYPGYIALKSNTLDYKLFPSTQEAEVFIDDYKKWYPFDEFGKKGLEDFAFWFHIPDDLDEPITNPRVLKLLE